MTSAETAKVSPLARQGPGEVAPRKDEMKTKIYEKAVEGVFPVTGNDHQIEVACILVNEAAEIDRLRDAIRRDSQEMAERLSWFAPRAQLGSSPLGSSAIENIKADHVKLLEKIEGLYRLVKVAGADPRVLRKAIAEAEKAVSP